MANIVFNTKDFDRGMANLQEKVKSATSKAIKNVAEDVLRRSQAEVPLDKGTLLNSGHTEHLPDESLVGYGGKAQVYAARLHEHPEFKFRNGRKGKYLEDPIKNNLSHYREIYGNIIGAITR